MCGLLPVAYIFLFTVLLFDCLFREIRNKVEIEKFLTKFKILNVLQALAAIPSINSEVVQQRLDRVRTYFELLNMPFEVSLLT